MGICHCTKNKIQIKGRISSLSGCVSCDKFDCSENSKTLIMILASSFLASCGGGGGSGDGIPTQPGEQIELSSVTPASKYSGLGTQGSITREKTREIIEDLLYLNEFIEFSINQVNTLGVNSYPYRIGEPKTTSVVCEEGGKEVITVDRRQDRVLVELYARDCVQFGISINGIMQFELFNESDRVNLRFVNFRSHDSLIHGEYRASVEGQLPNINLMFQEGERSFLVENLSMPRLLSKEHAVSGYQEVNSGRIYYSDEGYFLVNPGGQLYGDYPDDSKLVWSKTTIEGAEGGSSTVEVKKQVEEFDDYVWDSKVEVVLKETAAAVRKYYFAEYHEWLGLDFNKANEFPPQASGFVQLVQRLLTSLIRLLLTGAVVSIVTTIC